MSKSSGSGSSTTTQTTTPWSGVQKYLTGDKKTTGIYPEAQSQYKDSGWDSGMQSTADQYAGQIANRAGQDTQAYSAGNTALSGGYDANVQRVGDTSGVGNINAQSVDPNSAFSSLGTSDPTSANQKLLSGQVDTSTLDPLIASQQQRLADTFNQSTMPSIGQAATSAGQYGSSRQGIAEGLAAKGLAQAQGDISSSAYNNAYNTAQSNMYGTANNMSSLGLSNSTNNANRSLTADTTNASNSLNTQQYNASLGLNNNSQAIQNSAQTVANRTNGLNMLGTGNTMQDSNYTNSLAAQQAGDTYDWQNLSNYAGIVSPGASAGGTSSTSTPTSSNYGASALGGAMGGAGLASLFGMTGTGASASGLGTGLLTGGGALLGLLSDRRFKTDIEPMGKLDNGLTVYRYRYKAGGPMMLGVMADEVKSMNPGAVITENDIDYVNYGAL